jgi:hypothetical protein
MKEWLLERRFVILVVGVGVPLMFTVVFWSDVRPNWPFWLACYLVGLPAGIIVTWGRQRVREFWARLETRQRVLLRCLAVAAIWTITFLQSDDWSDRFFTATAVSVILVVLWGSYAVFSHLMDKVLSRARKR